MCCKHLKTTKSNKPFKVSVIKNLKNENKSVNELNYVINQ